MQTNATRPEVSTSLTALERLAEGADSLSRLALDLGFSSHSHFTTLFHRVFGVPPSVLKRRRRNGGPSLLRNR